MANSIEKLGSLDQRRLGLEQNVAKLRKALRHWQSCEAEYEGFKEEIGNLGSNASAAKIQAIADDFGGDILTAKECRDVLETSSGQLRDAAQISSVLSRRIDYVQENAKAVQKQLSVAESGITALDAVVEVPPRVEDALPLQEITEELDDDDNVISSNVADATSMAPEVLAALRKKGVKGIPESEAKTSAESSSIATIEELPDSLPDPSGGTSSANSEGGSADAVDIQQPKNKPAQRVKQRPPAEPQEDDVVDQDHPPRSGTVHEDVLRSLSNDFPDEPTIPSNETPEQAALRREMLAYNMNEVGAVVATMNLNQDERDEQDEEDEEYDDDLEVGSYDDDDEEYESEPEDEHGRTTVRVIDDKYRQEMLELEARLNARAIVNTGQATPRNAKVAKANNALREEDAAQPVVAKSSQSGKKGVRFADSLDIQESPSPAVTNDVAERPITDIIMERSAPVSAEPFSENSKKRVSKFRSMRSEINGTTPKGSTAQITSSIGSGPLAGMDASMLAPIGGKVVQKAYSGPIIPDEDDSKPILVDKLVERPMDENQGTGNLGPDEFDPDFMTPQVAKEYHRIRNLLIQRNGGFVNRDASDEDEGQEAESGKKISRFKAAKISQIRK